MEPFVEVGDAILTIETIATDILQRVPLRWTTYINLLLSDKRSFMKLLEADVSFCSLRGSLLTSSAKGEWQRVKERVLHPASGLFHYFLF